MKIIHIVFVALLTCFINVSNAQEKKDTTVDKKDHHEKMEYCCAEHHDMMSHKPGKCPKCHKEMILSPKEKMKYEVTRYFSCPHHPGMRSDKKGVCPKCKKPLEMHEEKHWF